MTSIKSLALTAALLAITSNNTLSAQSNSKNLSLKKELQELNKAFEKRISDLENQLNNQNANLTATSNRTIYGNEFNPSIGIILNGQYTQFSEDNSELYGFAIGEEGEKGKEGFSIGESELNFSSNIDDKFFGSLTAAIVNEEGSDIVELEEAFIKTTPGFGLPTGVEIKAGRSFWKIGYLNDHHKHSDDFSDRPLPYRAYLNNSFNDDGMQISYVLPTNFYTEVGGGVFRGDDFPFGEGDGTGPYSAYFRVGNDIGYNQNWRFGGYILSGEANSRVTNEDIITFSGDSDLYVADLRYVFTPTGNAKNQELTVQGEYFYRDETGTYEDSGNNTGAIDYDDNTSGWYLQTVYKFLPKWRAGVRYSQLTTSDAPTGLTGTILDADGHNPETITTMIDWTNSEFSRLRMQYSHDELSNNVEDDQFTLQYVMSFGAHGAHKY